jgi:hypothetical protein
MLRLSKTLPQFGEVRTVQVKLWMIVRGDRTFLLMRE